MIRLSSIIEQYESIFLEKYQSVILPSHIKALNMMKECRSINSPQMMVRCCNNDCQSIDFIPHSCGHRSCPHCQHYESQQWIENQLNQLVPARYYLLTFTLPFQFRWIAFHHQREVYNLMFSCIKEVLRTFTKNDKKLRGEPGLMMVLQTHSRELNFHPHVHVIMPGASIDKDKRIWRVKSSKYIFNYKAVAKVFRGTFLKKMVENHLPLPRNYPKKWIVDCRGVGKGKKAIIYLGKYLYKGVVQEKDILSCDNGQVTFRYIDSDTKIYQTKTLPGEDFLWLVMQHILPKGFRRVRNYGFLNPCSKQLIRLLQYLLNLDPVNLLKQLKPRPEIICKCCGSPMKIVRTMIQFPFPMITNTAF